MKASAFYADITAQETTQVSELEQVIELGWILQGNLLLIPSPMASWLQNGRSDDDVRGMGIFFRGFEYSCEEKRIFTFLWNAWRGRRTGRRRQGGRKWRKRVEK